MAITINSKKTDLLNSVAAAVVALPLLAGASFAQEAQAETQGTAQAQQSDPSQQAGDAGQATTQQQAQGTASDVLVATVGDAEIRSSDLMRAIGALPPQLSSQPPEMVMSMALQQLVLREAIVQEARSQGLAEDPEVQSLVEGATQSAEEDALVQVWLQREITNRVTPEAVDAAYAGLQAVTGEQPVPPLDQIRLQIEQSLAQQAINDIRGSLLSNTQVTVYGPDGQPMDPQSEAGGGQANSGDQSGGDQSGDGAAGGQDQSQGNAAGESGSDGEQDSTGEQSSGGNN